MSLEDRVRSLLHSGELDLPVPGGGATSERLHRLAEFAREDLSLGRLIEAHTDAIAILAEAGCSAAPGKLYGVWASESPEQQLRLTVDRALNGSKAFCSGGSIVDRALVTVRDPEPLLLEVDLKNNAALIDIDSSGWIATAFAETATSTVHFHDVPIAKDAIIGPVGWYLSRPGFWHGACGPAACWAGGAAGLWDYARTHIRENTHDLANLGAISATVWTSLSTLDQAAREIDADFCDQMQAQARALKLRHSIDRNCTEILDRFSRVYGPRPLAFDRAVERRFQEVQLYVRQCHAERDLEGLGRIALGMESR